MREFKRWRRYFWTCIKVLVLMSYSLGWCDLVANRHSGGPYKLTSNWAYNFFLSLLYYINGVLPVWIFIIFPLSLTVSILFYLIFYVQRRWRMANRKDFALTLPPLFKIPLWASCFFKAVALVLIATIPLSWCDPLTCQASYHCWPSLPGFWTSLLFSPLNYYFTQWLPERWLLFLMLSLGLALLLRLKAYLKRRWIEAEIKKYGYSIHS